jgi:hypothetical protein
MICSHVVQSSNPDHHTGSSGRTWPSFPQFLCTKAMGVFKSKSQHNLVLLFIQADDMFRPLF